ncbi:MAG: Trm112 family protein [Elusimicrobia bacterium]|nr:Trm112 family protein [Elusimicrobiota bacterium]
MAIDPELLKILACPVCKTPVDYRPAESALFCAKCRRRFAVKDDIPNMLPDEATVLPE